MDWTAFDKDGQATIAIYLVSSHGRATPLVWKTVNKANLKNRRGEWELFVIRRLHENLSEGVDIMVLVDRGFGAQNLFAYLDTIGWGYALRFKQNMQNLTVTVDRQSKPASGCVPASGHGKLLRDVRITQNVTSIGGGVLKHQKGMKEA